MDALKRIQSQFENTPFSAKEISKLGVSRPELNQLLSGEQVQRLSRGVYVLSGADLSDEAQFKAATMRIQGPSVVCLISALSYYNLTDLIPKQVWLLVPEDKHTAHKDIRVVRSRKPKWKVGIRHEDGFRITTLERSIVDSLTLKRIVGSSTGIEALKTAIRDKKTTLSNILEVATQLKVDHRIINYIEVLA